MENKRRKPIADIVDNRSGQSLILALMVMFLLVFVGGVFIALIARNISRTQRSGDTMSADYLAEAGIRYAGDQLTYSEDGADWRPVPSYAKVVEAIAAGVDPLTLAPAERPYDTDPDFPWLIQGFSRFTYGKGRFLLRVTYDPQPHDPMSRYIKIESIGRVGFVDAGDPSTLLDPSEQVNRHRVEKVAYKAIAINDYARFVTNKDRRSESMALGAPGYITQFGTWDDRNGNNAADPSRISAGVAEVETYGGSIRVNGNLVWHGKNYVWLDPLRNEAVEVAGDIFHEVDATAGDPTQVIVNLSAGAKPSADPTFNSLLFPINVEGSVFDSFDAGVYRDGRADPDVNGLPRSITRLEPPLLDIKSPGGGLSRYRELTRNSGEWRYNSGTGSWYNTGYFGWGQGLYIDNSEDVQPEGMTTTLRRDWMTPGGSQNWLGHYYMPPGVTIILTPYDLDGDDWPDLILIYNQRMGESYSWYDADGNKLSTTGGRTIMGYPRNGVIFTEGNIRIKGTLPPSTQLTVVSNATIYVEGSILKYPWTNNDPNAPNKVPIAPENQHTKDSAIALLAKDNICVNTTQFFRPSADALMPANWRPDLSCFAASVGRPMYFSYEFGEDPVRAYLDASGAPVPMCAYLRHTSGSGEYPSYMNMTINRWGPGSNPGDPADPWWGHYRFGLANWSAGAPPFPPARQYIYPLGDFEALELAVPPDPTDLDLHSRMVGEQRWPMWEHQVFTLGTGNYQLSTDKGSTNYLGFKLDQNLAKADYLLSRVAAQPSDVRIEALLYAQNGSFFIIPGEWFNPDSEDTWGNYNDPSIQKGRKTRTRIDPRWPFHGDPLDVKITIFGAISENVPAPVSDAAAWMDKWGWIPGQHGSETDPSHRTVTYRPPMEPDPSHPNGGVNDTTVKRQGLTILYDRLLSYPRVPSGSGPDRPVRPDYYGRPLPSVPKLPVSPQTLYFGQPT